MEEEKELISVTNSESKSKHNYGVDSIVDEKYSDALFKMMLGNKETYNSYLKDNPRFMTEFLGDELAQEIVNSKKSPEKNKVISFLNDNTVSELYNMKAEKVNIPQNQEFMSEEYKKQITTLKIANAIRKMSIQKINTATNNSN